VTDWEGGRAKDKVGRCPVVILDRRGCHCRMQHGRSIVVSRYVCSAFPSFISLAFVRDSAVFGLFDDSWRTGVVQVGSQNQNHVRSQALWASSSASS